MVSVLRPGQRILSIPGIGVTTSRRAVASAIPSASSLLTGLVAYWTMDETSGNRLDSVASHTAVPNNAPGYAAGKHGNAVDLERDSNQYLTVTDHADIRFGTGSFSLSYWMKPETLMYGEVSQGTIVSKNYTGFESYIYQGRNHFYLGGTANQAVGSIDLSTGVWYHVCCVRNGSAVATYINGSANGSSTNSADVSNAGTDLSIGTRVAGSTLCFDGLIDEIGLWNRAITDDERTALYAAGDGVTYPFTGT